jgi:hypothetical protein
LVLPCALLGTACSIASNDEYESLVVGCGLEFRPLPGTHGMFDDPQWMQLQERGGLASAPKLLRVLADHVRTLHKAILAVARQDGPDVLGLSGVVSVGGYQVAEGLACQGWICCSSRRMPPPTSRLPLCRAAGLSAG